MEIRNIILGMVLLLIFQMSAPCFAEQVIVASKADTAPMIDGNSEDKAWKKAQTLITHDKIADIDIHIKAVYADGTIFLLVVYPDPDESRLHKPWVWKKDLDMYEMGADREDVFVFKWNMESKPTDLSVYADLPYTADVWFWKACRTDPAGFADDKIQWLRETKISQAKQITSKSGKTMYLIRQGDAGKPAYRNEIYAQYQGDKVAQFKSRTPEGSRADIRAKGLWSGGKWAIEWSRKLTTGHDDDIQLSPGTRYQLGVSRYEIAARKPDPHLAQPLYGSGDIAENLFLVFED